MVGDKTALGKWIEMYSHGQYHLGLFPLSPKCFNKLISAPVDLTLGCEQLPLRWQYGRGRVKYAINGCAFDEVRCNIDNNDNSTQLAARN